MTDLKLAAQKASLSLIERALLHVPIGDDNAEELTAAIEAVRSLCSALQHQEEREPVLFYAFKHNHGNGKIGWTFHTPEEQATAYRDTCLEIIPLVPAAIATRQGEKP